MIQVLIAAVLLGVRHLKGIFKVKIIYKPCKISISAVNTAAKSIHTKLHLSNVCKAYISNKKGGFLTVMARRTTSLPQMYNLVSSVSKKPWRCAYTAVMFVKIHG